MTVTKRRTLSGEGRWLADAGDVSELNSVAQAHNKGKMRFILIPQRVMLSIMWYFTGKVHIDAGVLPADCFISDQLDGYVWILPLNPFLWILSFALVANAKIKPRVAEPTALPNSSDYIASLNPVIWLLDDGLIAPIQ